MANKTIYPFGPGGNLPSNIGVINDLETGGADKALSAEQGVVLKKTIDGLPYTENVYDLASLVRGAGNYINMTENVWKSSSTTKSFFVSIVPGHKYRITAGASQARFAILTSAVDTLDTTPAYATGETNSRNVPAGSSYEFTAPDDAHYLSVHKTLTGNTITPASLVEIILDTSVETEISELRGKFSECVDFDTLNVLSNDTSYITITKDSVGGIKVENKESAGSKYALIQLPDSLVVGDEYVLSFHYDADFHKNSAWWFGFVDSSYQPTSGGVNVYSGFRQLARVVFTHKQGDAYIRFACTSQNSGAYVYIKDFSITRNGVTVAELSNKVKALEEGEGNDEMESLIRQARFINSSPTVQPLTLLHFTDIHGDTLAANQILSFYNKYKTKINDMVQTGDTVYYYWNSSGQDYQWYQNSDICKALFVLGNHDGSADDNSHGWKEGSADWDFKGKEWDFDTYFANYITERGVTPPAGYDDPNSVYYKACYWHKDYSAAKVRLIGLDCMHFNDGVRYTNNDQETWLAARLADTLNSSNPAYGYSVIFLCHYPLDDYSGANETWVDENHRFTYNQNETGGHVIDRNTQRVVNCHYGSSFTAEKKFSLRNRVGTPGSTDYTKGNNNPLGDIIQSWINNGGKFIAWLSGHTHTEYMYYPAKYPGMLVIGLPQAGNTRGNGTADRSDASDMHYCANLYVIDTENTLLKIIRIGKTMDKYLMEFKTLCYNYTNKIVSR